MTCSDLSPPLPRACLLALDTATESVHVALQAGREAAAGTGDHVAEHPGGQQASATLLPALQALLTAAGRTWRDLDAIAFGRGPGAFTGLRTAASVAQGLAFGLDCPVLPLDTLMAVAEDARLHGADAGCVWVANDARMGELYVAVYAWQPGTAGGPEGGAWTTLSEPALTTPAAWLADVEAAAAPGEVDAAAARENQAASTPQPDRAMPPRPTAFAGSAWRVLGDTLAPAARQAAVWADAAPRGAALLNLARQAWAGGRQQDAAQAVPLYVRDRVALTTAERAAEREATRAAGGRAA